MEQWNGTDGPLCYVFALLTPQDGRIRCGWTICTEEATRTHVSGLNSDGFIHNMRAVQGYFGRNRVDPSLFDSEKVPFTWSEHIYHVGSALGRHSITHSGLVAGGKDEMR